MLEAGMKAPDFTLRNAKDQEVSLSSLRGQKVIVYFYPRDNTPGCTREALNYKELYEAFQARQVEVIGISKDSVKSHDKFACKYELPFILLSDPELQAIQLMMSGRKRSCTEK